MSNPPKFTFGGPASTGASSGSLFGTAGAAKPLFGQSTGNTPDKAPTPNLFGNTTTPAEAKPLFGAATGSTGGSSGFSFGKQATAPATATPSLFGAASTGASSGFGSVKPAEQSSGGMQQSTTPAQTPAATPLSNLFGAPPASQPASSGGLFANFGSNTTPQLSSATATPAATKTNPLNFSTTPAGPPPSSGNSLFGTKPSGTTTSLFGQKADDKPASSPFGQAPASSGGGLFGPKEPVSTATNQQNGSNMFGSAPQNQGQASSFSKPAAPNDAPKPAFSLGQTANKPLFGEVQKSSDAQPPKLSFTPGPAADAGAKVAATTAPSSNLFGGANPAPTPATAATPNFLSSFGKPKDTSTQAAATAAPATSLFSLGKKDEGSKAGEAAPLEAGKQAAAEPLKLGAFKLGQQTPASTTTPASTAVTAPGFFNQQKETQSGQPGISNTTSTNNTTSTLGASTTGPAPPAASRLAAKSLDEILTLWTTSLTSHQKSFGSMATRIAGWDRQLVENSDKISKLYARTFQAERDTAEVERQLTAVEGEQQELERYLDQYERTVDELIARNGGIEGGIDAEREKTYRIAERCSSRLTSMSHDLTSMIEEINSASTNLRQSNKSTNGQDPLTQIVRVLNGHLSQLQVIDQGASALQQKVTVAQREARSIGKNGALGNDEVDGFARSFLGRR